MANRDILAIGTSAGGVEALLFLTGNLQRDLPASVLLTIHLPSHARSSLDDLLSSRSDLPARFAQDGETLRKSRIYIAPPDRHLIVDDDRVLARGRPARKQCPAGHRSDAAFGGRLLRWAGYWGRSHRHAERRRFGFVGNPASRRHDRGPGPQ